MDGSQQFPDDVNGAVLRRMNEGGDPLTEPRIVDFNFIFPQRKQAVGFAELVDERDLEVCISYYEERDMWQAIVKRYMIPSHRTITTIESDLSIRAKSVGGQADGWGCMRLTANNDA